MKIYFKTQSMGKEMLKILYAGSGMTALLAKPSPPARTHIPNECQFVFRLLHFQSSSLLMVWGRSGERQCLDPEPS